MNHNIIDVYVIYNIYTTNVNHNNILVFAEQYKPNVDQTNINVIVKIYNNVKL